MVSPKVSPPQTLGAAIAQKLLMLERTPRCTSTNPQRRTSERREMEGTSTASVEPVREATNEAILVVTEGTEAVLGTVASRTVIGSNRIKGFLATIRYHLSF